MAACAVEDLPGRIAVAAGDERMSLHRQGCAEGCFLRCRELTLKGSLRQDFGLFGAGVQWESTEGWSPLKVRDVHGSVQCVVSKVYSVLEFFSVLTVVRWSVFVNPTVFFFLEPLVTGDQWTKAHHKKAFCV